MGIVSGDALLVHSAYGRFLGFQGSPNELIDTFLEAVGTGGNLLMVSMPFTTSMSEYLKSTTVFDVRKTPSKMGLLSETFRRRPGVLRSLHPTHPVLACGPKAEWIVSGHENCSYPCAEGSPFEKLLQLNGKVLFFGVPEFNFTFHHYLEDMVKNDLPFALYEEQPHVVKVIDRLGETRSVKVYAFTKDAISRRRLHILLDELARRGQMIRTRIGNTRMVLVASADTVACTKELARRDVYFFEMA
jgi:aminoglycoside 3-N-acetyltransferase